jgi:5-methylcytosine-specific restriction endonuclease McrA
MHVFSLEHRPNDELRRDLEARFASERVETAELVVHIAEFDARGLYTEAGFDSMHDYCMRIGRLSEDAAYRRLHAARALRKFPCLFPALADGRLNLSAVCILAPHLTPENVDECVAAAKHRSNAQIRDWLVARLIAPPSKAAPAPPPARQLEVRLPSVASTRVTLPLTAPAEAAGRPAPEAPRGEDPALDAGPIEFEMHFTISREDQDRFRYAQALLSHAVSSGDVAAIYRRAIEALITECEKRKFAARDENERAEEEAPTRNNHGRRIPAHVRRAVWVRDGGRCAFVAPSGQRCGARRQLEFDHVTPVSRGGPSTVENVRLCCRSHNQEEARRALGTKFMNRKRRQAAIATAVGSALPAWNGVGSKQRGRVMKA